MEHPGFPLWKRRHASLEAINPDEYKAKHDTRKAYQWIVLEHLQYDPGLLHQQQWTWPRAPTAWGAIRAVSEPRGRKVFTVEACTKGKRDTYKVVFAQDGTFITAISKTRNDVKSRKFLLSRRGAGLLLRLNEQVPDADLRLVTEEAVNTILSPQSAKFAKDCGAVWNIYIPRAIRLGLITGNVAGPRFTYGQEKTRLEVRNSPEVDQRGTGGGRHRTGTA
jgi:hypothetical protein